MLSKKIQRVSLNLIFLLSLIVVSFNIAWHLSSVADYFYKPLYSALNIQAHIKKYAPENIEIHFRSFADTRPKQHYRLFGEIIDSINHGGMGLEEISFNVMNSDNFIRLLTSAEVRHLEDIAKLVAVFNWTAIVSALLVAFCLWCLYKSKRTLFAYKSTLMSLAATVIVLATSVLLIDPKILFYYLHQLIFFENQWFFYYEESLMVTLMKAPDIFGYIAIGISLLAIIVFVALWAVSHVIMRQR